MTHATPFPQVWIPPQQTKNLLLSATDTTEADELFCMIGQATPKIVQTQKLQKLLTWATQAAADSEEPFHPTAKRAAAIALVLERAISLAHAHARGADRTRALALSNSLTHAQTHARKIVAQLKNSFYREVEVDSQMSELSQGFIQDVTQSWFEGQFDAQLLELSQAEAEALNRYLHASEWMVQCIEARIGISQHIWETTVACLIQPLDSVN